MAEICEPMLASGKKRQAKLSVLFYEKNKAFPITGIASVCMVFSIMFSRFEQWGRFSNTLPGPYLGLISVLINLVLLILLYSKNVRRTT